jgi:hypothetical protein
MSMEQIWEKIRGKKNVVGYSKKLRRRIRDGREVEEEVIRIYVSRKVDASALDLKDLIPSEIDGIPTDVVEIGEMKALGLHPLTYDEGSPAHRGGERGELGDNGGDPRVVLQGHKRKGDARE